MNELRTSDPQCQCDAMLGNGRHDVACPLYEDEAALIQLADLVWELTDDSEESAQTGEVTMALTKEQNERLCGLFWRLGGKYRRGLADCGWTPAKHERRVIGHASGWQEQMCTCVCGKPWPCQSPMDDWVQEQIALRQL